MKFAFKLLLLFLIGGSIIAPYALGQKQDLNDTCVGQSFDAGKSVPLSGTSSVLASADFNNDGKRDIAAGIIINNSSRVEIKLGDGAGSFTSSEVVSTLSFISYLTTADFNGDGNLDLLVSHRLSSSSNGVSLLAGDGTGHFTNLRTISFNGEPFGSVAGDFNGDDRTDFAVTDWVLNKVIVYYGDNNGNFSLAGEYVVGTNPVSIAMADFNGDGRLDLIAANTGSAFVSVLPGAAEGGFNQPFAVDITANTKAMFVSVDDVNNDGKADAVVASVGTSLSGASILLGNGAGGFSLQPLLSSDWGISKLYLADVNGDAKPDLINTGGQYSSMNSVRIGIGDGTFGSEFLFASPGAASSMAVGDFNSDGKADIAQSGSSGAEFMLYEGKGNGRFGAHAFETGGNPNSTAVADFNLDGKPDVAVGNYDLSSVSVLTNDGSGNLTLSSSTTLTMRPYAVASGDFNSDGKPDLATITLQGASGGSGFLVIMLNNGSGFSSPVFYSVGSLWYLRAITIGDATGDGIADIVIASVDSPGYIAIVRGNGNGTFTFLRSISVLPSINAYTPWGVAIADFNLDGKKDLATAAAGGMLVYLGDGAGNFTPGIFSSLGSNTAEFVIGDFNEDSIPDAAVTNNNYNAQSPNFIPTVMVSLGNGAGGFLTPTIYQTGRGTASIAIGDINNDGHVDLAIANSYNSYFADNRVGVLYGNGTGVFSNPVSRFVGGINSFDVSIADLNADGKSDIVTPNYNSGNVSVLLNRCLSSSPTDFPTLNMGQDMSATETDQGTASVDFTVSLSSPSSRQITVDYYTSPITAIGTADYKPVHQTLVFLPNEVSKTITVSINGDLTDEFNENLNIYLSNPNNALLGDKAAVLTIVEDQDPAPSVSIGDLSFVEGEFGTVTASLPVTLSAVSGKPISVQFTTAPGTAIENTDFIPATGTLTIPAGSQSRTADVLVKGDTLVEPDENFFVAINNPVNASLNRTQAMATITNDDIGGNVQFGNATFSVAENAGTATVTVTRANGSASAIVVQYRSTDGTAFAGQDYSAVSGSVTFGAFETSKTFTVPIINDSLDEDSPETVNLTLSEVAGGATMGTPFQVTLNIVDDDPPPQISLSGTSVNEGTQGTTTATVNVSLSAASAKEVRVNYATQDGTAVSPGDYLATSGVITFFAGETSKTISVSIVGDTVIEPNETFNLVLTGPVNATFNNSTVQVTITNDDFLSKIADFDGDKKTDLSVFRPSNGEWWYQQSSDNNVRAFTFGTSTDKIVPADYDGDSKTDIAFFRPSTGEWFVLRSSNLTFFAAPFGNSTDIPAPGDFDGDGKADFAVFRQDAGAWFINKTSGGVQITPFGTNGDIPVVADYDADGKADMAIYRGTGVAGNGEWWILRSTAGLFATPFGTSTDRPVPGDYTGDGRADAAFWRPSTGEWFVLRSDDLSFYAFQFGANGDIPAPGDYDGDGRVDAAVFRPSGATWYVLKSTGGTLIQGFGSNGDRPVPSP